METGRPTVLEDAFLCASRLRQRVRENREITESVAVVDRTRQANDALVIPVQPGPIEGKGTKWIAEDIPEQGNLISTFLVLELWFLDAKEGCRGNFGYGGWSSQREKGRLRGPSVYPLQDLQIILL